MSNGNHQYAPFEKIKILGEGSYGKAYLVKQLTDNTLAVLKQIDMSKMGHKEMTDAFKEAEILKHLNHPCIVRIKDVLKTKSNKLWMVLEYADGGDLDVKIKKQKHLRQFFDENTILEWFTQMSLAVKHCHDRKIIHRDLKCQNIFLMKSGRIKLGDFGIAKVLNNTRDISKTVIGTPYYISPEIINNNPYRFETDIWSLGVILFELMKLDPPFQAKTLQLLSLKIVKGKYEDPGNYSKEIKSLLASLLQVNPNRRPKISDILNHPLIKNRVNKYLSGEEIKDEFSHTILHNQRINVSQDRLKLNFKNLKIVNNENVARKPEEQPAVADRVVDNNINVINKYNSQPKSNISSSPSLNVNNIDRRNSNNSKQDDKDSKGKIDRDKQLQLRIQKEKEIREQLIREKEQNEREIREKRDREQKERDAREIREKKEREMREVEMREKLIKEKERILREKKEKEFRDREARNHKEMRNAKELNEIKEKKNKLMHHHNHNHHGNNHIHHHQLHPQHKHIVNHHHHQIVNPKPAVNVRESKNEQEEIKRRQEKEIELEERKRQRDEERLRMKKDIEIRREKFSNRNNKVNISSDNLKIKQSNESASKLNINNSNKKDSNNNKLIDVKRNESSSNLRRSNSNKKLLKPFNKNVEIKKNKLNSNNDISSNISSNRPTQTPSQKDGKPAEEKIKQKQRSSENYSSRSNRDNNNISGISDEVFEFIESQKPVIPRYANHFEDHLFEYSDVTEYTRLNNNGFGQTARFVGDDNYNDIIEEIKRASNKVDERFELETNELFINDRPVLPSTNLDFITIKKKGPAIQVEEEDQIYYLSGYGQLEDLRLQIEKKVGSSFYDLYNRIKDVLEDPDDQDDIDRLYDDTKYLMAKLEMPLNSIELAKNVTMITKFIIKEQTVIESGKNEIKSQIM